MGQRLTCDTSDDAAAWLARLRADDRSVADEAAFRAWRNTDRANAFASGAMNAVWESVGALPAIAH